METNTRNPGAAIIKAWQQMANAVRAKWALIDSKAPTAERLQASRVADVAAVVLSQLQQEAREAFAKSRGWRLSSKRRLLDPPVIDHAEFYLDVDGNVVGLVSHCYASKDEIATFASTYGLRAEVLPFSWWAPHVATAVLLTLRVGGEWPTQAVRNRRAMEARKALASQKRAHANTLNRTNNGDLA